MLINTEVTPEDTTLETITTLETYFVAFFAFDSSFTALFNGKHIQQSIDSKVGRQIIELSTTGDSTLSSTFWASYDIMAATRS